MCVERAPELASARAEYATKDASQRREVAERAYDSSVADSMFGQMLAQMEKDLFRLPHYLDGVESLAVDPFYAPALLTVGSLEYQFGRPREAMVMFMALTALPLDEEDPAIIIDRAGGILIDQGDYARALQLYEAAEAASPTDVIHPSGACYCFGTLRKEEEAIATERRAVAREPRNGSRWNNLEWSRYEAGQLDEVQTCLRRALDLSDEPQERAKDNLAAVLNAKAARSREEAVGGEPREERPRRL